MTISTRALIIILAVIGIFLLWSPLMTAIHWLLNILGIVILLMLAIAAFAGIIIIAFRPSKNEEIKS